MVRGVRDEKHITSVKVRQNDRVTKKKMTRRETIAENATI